MRDVLGNSLKRLKWIRVRRKRMVAVLLVLSLVVSVNVFWVLRQPGLTLAGDATCGIQEHTHDAECSSPELVCTLPIDTHTHDETCYTTIVHEPVQETILTCERTEEEHEHSDACYTVTVVEEGGEERVLTCELPEEGHIHQDTCYETTTTCQLEEHVHSLTCYADETADVETMLDWQNMFAGYPFTGDLRKDLVGIAKTQVGYAESEWNFQIGDDGVRRGYTRYGAWYGTPYRDWSAMFVSFCLNYAKADPNENPGNTGASAMAELWEKLGKYAPAGAYNPVPGDLVFFKNNTVGIVTEVQSATIYVIRGDIDDAVTSDAVPMADGSIIGWGITVTSAEEATPEQEETSVQDPLENTTPTDDTEDTAYGYTWEELLEGSDRPAFFIFANGVAPQQTRKFTLKTTKTATDLSTYLQDKNGGITIKLYNDDGSALTPDENNNYVVDPDILYELRLVIKSPRGIHPGTYTYQLPAGLTTDTDTGNFMLKDPISGEFVEVGTWSVTKDGLITLVFNDNMANQSNVEIPAAMNVHFNAQDDSIVFDGNITVTVNPPPDYVVPTALSKWGSQGYEESTEGKTDPSKIYWTVKIDGNEDSLIPGSVLTDNIVNGDWYAVHRYTDSDIAAGIRFDAQDPNGNWHRWVVMQGDPNLNWTEDGWSYTIPETVVCKDGETLTLGNDGWEYLVNYTTTPEPSENVGSFTYANQANVDNQTYDGYVKFLHGNADGDIQKVGSFQADAAGGSFQWEVTTIVPGIQEGQKAVFWNITDNMNLYTSSGSLPITNDMDKATVTATYNGTTIPVTHPRYAGDTDPFAWYVAWSADANGVYYGRTIGLLCRCACTAENCVWWNEQTGCGSKPWLVDENGQSYQDTTFCMCWIEDDTTSFTFTYQTDDLSIIENYGNADNTIGNYAELYYTVVIGDDYNSPSVGNAWTSVTIPGLFKKELTQDFNGYTAHYSITVNEAKLTLTDGSPLTIHDVMTDTLAYISGTLVITAEDANGVTTTLHQDTDFTVTYDGSGSQTDEKGNKVHILDIKILHPQPVKYTLDYDATLIMSGTTDDGVKYGNSASITLWGETIKDDIQKETDIEFGISGESYAVSVNKTSALTQEKLGGAVFGLFNDNDGQIATATTNDNGLCTFKTDIIQGIILREHELYYIQELEAPTGYQLDNTKFWFCFCNNAADVCETCEPLLRDNNGVRIPYGQMGPLNITNEVMNYDLPATGGPGIYPLILVSVVFVITPLVYGCILRRKRERRGVG